MKTKKDISVPTFYTGDKVKILRTAKAGEGGWENDWLKLMDEHVGKIGTVMFNSNGEVDVNVEVDGDEDGCGWGYPAFVLELVSKKTEDRDMLTRAEVFQIIDRERNYQDESYNPAEILSSSQTRRQRDLDVSPGILMIEGYTQKAREAWIDTQNDNIPALQQVAKIAAIAVRILERAGGSSKLLRTGLR